jgi:hypothetical protein
MRWKGDGREYKDTRNANLGYADLIWSQSNKNVHVHDYLLVLLVRINPYHSNLIKMFKSASAPSIIFFSLPKNLTLLPQHQVELTNSRREAAAGPQEENSRTNSRRTAGAGLQGLQARRAKGCRSKGSKHIEAKGCRAKGCTSQQREGNDKQRE